MNNNTEKSKIYYFNFYNDNLCCLLNTNDVNTQMHSYKLLLNLCT